MSVAVPLAASAPRERPARTPRLLIDGAHLAVLSAFAIAQPLFSLLGKNPQFFAARGSRAIDVVVCALVLTLALPLLLAAIEGLAGLVDAHARRALHLLFVAALLALFALQVIKDGGLPANATLAVAGVVGSAGAALYARAAAARSVLTILSPAPIVFAALFVFLSPVSKLVLPQPPAAHAASAGTRTPIVMLILDELPSTDLLGPDRRIDAARYPSFARLAASSTWYRNATTVYDSTTEAVPAILTGKLPGKGRLAIYADHPNSVFTLFGQRAQTNVSEEATSLCPHTICRETRGGALSTRMSALASDLSLVYRHVALPEEMSENLPSISETWGDFGEQAEASDAPDARAAKKRSIRYYLNRERPGRLEQWIARIRPSSGRSLNVKHALLPHVPLQYLPSGVAYRTVPNDQIPGLSSEPNFDDELVVEQSRQRHLLQVGFVDREIGRLIDRLRRTGMWDKALVVVVADHGAAYRRDESRRRAAEGNLHQIAPIPVFIKAPGQARGRVSDVWLRSIDVLPTMASILRVRIPWRHDGRPATSATVRNRRSVMMIKRDFSARMTLGADEMTRRVGRELELKTRLFGSGDAQPGLYGIGPNPQLVGNPLAELDVAAPRPDGPRAKLDQLDLLSDVERASRFVPALITGAIENDAADARHDFAIAVNGRVEAVTHSVYLEASPTTQSFAAMVPDSALRDGPNAVRIFLVEQRDGRLRLTPVGGT